MQYLLTPEEYNDLMSRAKTPEQLQKEREEMAMAALEFCEDVTRSMIPLNPLERNRAGEAAIKFINKLGLSPSDMNLAFKQRREQASNFPGPSGPGANHERKHTP